MTVEVRPLGIACNLACSYCYQHPMRDAGNFTKAPYDLEAIKRAVEAEGGSFTLFGGEPLLMPLEDLEELWRWGFERFGQNGIQTNGSLITDEHIALFKKYRVRVGISMDGPDELNDSRWAGSLEKTREMTRRTQAAIERLCQEGMPPSLIVTLHRLNATPERRPRLKAWLKDLEAKGVWSVRLHNLEVDHPLVRKRLALTHEEAVEAFLDMARFQRELRRMRFDLFDEIVRLLRGDDSNVTCVWNNCDPYTTPAVRGVEGNGERSNCGRTNKDGIDWYKADRAGWERYIALYHTPPEYGGCKGCRFFLMCRGNCPGTSLSGDWRNRSEDCAVWQALFAYFEDRLLEIGEVPFSLAPEREQVERAMVEAWERGERPTMLALRRMIQGQSHSQACGGGYGDHGDHWDAPHGDGHGDMPHGDSHGDHTDLAALVGVRGVAPVGAP